jgi:kinesin family member 1
LTRILKDSLDETSNVALIICISPSLSSYKETLSTLQFAERAKRAVLNNTSLMSREHSVRNLNPTGSQISLLYNPSSISGGSCGIASEHQNVNHIVRAYEEEKAIRMGLQ